MPLRLSGLFWKASIGELTSHQRYWYGSKMMSLGSFGVVFHYFLKMQDISLQEILKTKSMCVVFVVQMCLCFRVIQSSLCIPCTPLPVRDPQALNQHHTIAPTQGKSSSKASNWRCYISYNTSWGKGILSDDCGNPSYPF